MLLAYEECTRSRVRYSVETREITVAELGFADGATFDQIVAKAGEIGLAYCPLELGPYFRLQFLDQPEGSLGYPPTKHQAPPGSIIIASLPLSEDYEIPKGFYLRRIEGVLWLRGYRAGREHVCNPHDHFVFRCA